MAEESHILLGIITRVHGFEGAVAVKLEENFSENIPETESVFLEIEGRPVPFFIEYAEHVKGTLAHFKFLDYDSAERIREFCGCKIFIGTEYVHNTGILSPEIEGYKVISDKGIAIGHIAGIIKNPSQWILRVTSSSKKEILIPLHEDLIIELNDHKRIIKIIVAEGLADIY